MYSIDYLEEAKKDMLKLDKNIQIKVLKKLKQISNSPEIGQNLGNKLGLNLSGYKKAYIDSKRIRIVYKIIENKIQVLVIAIGKRDNEFVYKKSFERIKNNN